MSVVVAPARRGYHTLRAIMEMIKFEHTVFALPFAIIGALYAARGFPSWRIVGWILCAMVGARSAAMAFNRLADHEIDALNPRTQFRALPTGILRRAEVILFTICAIGLFEVAAWQLNPLCFALSPVALSVILGYSYSKRFTPLSHLWLGLSLGIAPTAAWIAVRGSIDWRPMALSLGVMFWTAGFDVIYSLQDLEFDTSHRLRSVPERFGVPAACRIARLLHLAAVTAFVSAGWAMGAGTSYFIGVTLVASLLIYEHRLVRPTDLSRIGVAFFNVNGYVSVGLLAFVLLDIFVGRRPT